ncbi:MAG: Crp/Fnr family transcriptional regulator [Solimonas sp.]
MTSVAAHLEPSPAGRTVSWLPAYFTRHALLGRTRPETRSALAEVAYLRYFASGARVAAYGDACDSINLVIHGAVEIGWADADGRRAVLSYLQVGEFMNIAPLIDRQPLMYDVRAHGSATLACIPATTFLACLDRDPVLTRGMLDELAWRSRFLHEALRHQALVPLRARLARYLLFLAQRHGNTTAQGLRIDMRLSQDDLAAMLNSSRQSINKELRAFAEQALISVGYSVVLLLRPDELERIAG